MSTEFHVIIPARYHSSRLLGKLLMDINGMTVIERVYRQALLSNAKSVMIATDSVEIMAHAKTFGADVVMTLSTHQSGTDRVAEAVEALEYPSDAIIVNVQGDEPFMSPLLIKQVALTLEQKAVSIATLCWPIDNLADLLNPNVVKVVRDRNNKALYFSRSAIPMSRDNPHTYQNRFRHIGLYAYRAAFLLEYVSWPVCELEAQEALEQLRVLWTGYPIQVETACVAPQQDINTADDLHRARALSVAI